MVILSVFLISLVVFLIWRIMKCIIWAIRAANMTYNIPGPKPWPIVGNGLLLAKINTPKEAIEFLIDLCNEYGAQPARMIKLWIGAKLAIIVTNPKYIEKILSSPAAMQKDSVYDFIGLVGNGLFVRNGKEWQDLRKPLDKLLTKKMVESNLDLFHEKSIKLCNVLNKYAKTGESFNVRHYITNFTIDALSVSTFGYDLNEIEKDNYNISELIDCVIENLVQLVKNFINVIYLPLATISNEGKRLKETCKSLWKLSCEILEARIENRKKLQEDFDDKPTFYSDVLIQKAKDYKLSWEEAGKLATDFLVAGFDTSAATISYILLMLAIYPEHQEAIYQEQLDILGDNPEVAPIWQQLSKMDYLTRVLKEVMRLYSPPGIYRKLTNDLELEGEYKLPKGCTTFILFYYLHRDPTLWSHPNEFYPDHFLPEECARRPKNTYFPFSWGPRSCPGSHYAIASAKILISAAIRKYKFETDLTFDKLEYKYSLLLEVSQGYLVRIKSRN